MLLEFVLKEHHEKEHNGEQHHQQVPDPHAIVKKIHPSEIIR